MNILIVSTGSGLFKPATGDRNRFFNLAVSLSHKNRVIVLQPYNVKDSLDQSVGEVEYFKSSLFGISFSILADLNPSYIIKYLTIMRKNEIDLIQISHPSGILISKLLSRLCRKNIPIIYDAHNVDSDSVQSIRYLLNSSIPFTKKLIPKLYLILVPLIEKIAVNFADFIISVSEIDRIRFINMFGINQNKIEVIPNGVCIDSIVINHNSNRLIGNNDVRIFKIFFHGSFNQAANFEAFNLIKNYIAPQYSKIFKDEKILFLVAGTYVPVFEENNIKSMGFVKDLYSILQEVDIAIVPIRAGGGTKLKILDYMGAGLPIVTTKKGIEGINATNHEHAMIVDDVDRMFIDSINYLVNNEYERKRIGANARKLAEDEYDWNKIGKDLDRLYRKILERKHEIE